MNRPRPADFDRRPSHLVQWWMLPAFAFMSVVLCAILAVALLLDFGRWLLTPIWPIEPQHPERPGP